VVVAICDMRDPYALTAEFYEVLARDQRALVLSAMRTALGGVDASAGPVLELRAGTGMGTLTIAEAIPTVEIVALEPSPAMRAVLLARIAERDELRQRVTVLPWGFPIADNEMPERFSAAVGLAMLEHLDPAARAQLWRLLAARLAPQAPAVFELQPPARPEVILETGYTRTRLGCAGLRGIPRRRANGSVTMRWTMRWRNFREAQLIREHVAQHSEWWTISQADIEHEVAAAGLRCSTAAEGLLVLRRA